MILPRLAVCLALAAAAHAEPRDSASHAAQDTTAFVMHQSPLAATLLSAVVPGAGQWYNREYLKVPIIWGIGGFLLYEVIANNNQYLKYKSLYFGSPDSTIRGNPQYASVKEAYRDNRDYYGAFLFLVYVLNIADAYVGAHLFDFPHTAAAQMSIAPSRSAWDGVEATLRIRLP